MGLQRNLIAWRELAQLDQAENLPEWFAPKPKWGLK